MESPACVLIDRAGLTGLVEVLRADGYQVVGPTVRDDAIVLDTITSAAELPAGWGVETGPGRYRLRRRPDEAVFGHSAGPQSWKQFLHPPRRKLFDAEDGEFQPARTPPPRYAFLGVRGCDLAAMGVLGRVLGAGTAAEIRARAFVIAVDCTEPGGVCFCASMRTGPGASGDYDLRLTERADDHGHRFLVDVGSPAGARIIAQVRHRAAGPADVSEAATAVAAAEQMMGRAMPDADLPEVLRRNRESPHWADVASRCLTCGNCTMVCPTCFCTSTEDVTDLRGEHAQRWERWASCFEPDFSYVHGGSVRQSGASKYRQWLTHKLGTWHDQFGESGCVGCGRCVAWCPVGIDVTEEVARLAGPARPEGADRDD